jgi:hypothetical protein
MKFRKIEVPVRYAGPFRAPIIVKHLLYIPPLLVVGGALRARLEHSSLSISAMKSKRVDKTRRALGINEDSTQHFCLKA